MTTYHKYALFKKPKSLSLRLIITTVTAKRFNFTQYATCTRIDREREREREARVPILTN